MKIKYFIILCFALSLKFSEAFAVEGTCYCPGSNLYSRPSCISDTAFCPTYLGDCVVTYGCYKKRVPRKPVVDPDPLSIDKESFKKFLKNTPLARIKDCELNFKKHQSVILNYVLPTDSKIDQKFVLVENANGPHVGSAQLCPKGSCTSVGWLDIDYLDIDPINSKDSKRYMHFKIANHSDWARNSHILLSLAENPKGEFDNRCKTLTEDKKSSFLNRFK